MAAPATVTAATRGRRTRSPVIGPSTVMASPRATNEMKTTRTVARRRSRTRQLPGPVEHPELVPHGHEGLDGLELGGAVDSMRREHRPLVRRGEGLHRRPGGLDLLEHAAEICRRGVGAPTRDADGLECGLEAGPCGDGGLPGVGVVAESGD